MEIFINLMDRIVALIVELMIALGFVTLDNPEFVAADDEATNVLNNE